MFKSPSSPIFRPAHDSLKRPISMPVLDNLKHVFQLEFGSDFSKLPNRHNTVFVIVQHGFVTIEPMMEAVLELGVPFRHVFMTTKPHTTPKHMEDYFLKRFGDKNYIPFQWQSTVGSGTVESPYKVLGGITHKKLFKNFYDFISSYEGRDINNVIICDEGGKFLSEFIHHYHNPDSRVRRNLNECHVVAVEHTKCGTYNSTLKNLPFPLILMADSYLKTGVESEYIAKSMFKYLDSTLRRLIDLASTPIILGVVGAGNIGKEVIHFLLKNYPHISVRIYDKNPDVLSSTEIQEKGWVNVARADVNESPFQRCNIILGCTGIDITEGVSQEEYVLGQSHDIHLISCSSGDIEFQTLLRKATNYKFESLKDICKYTIELGGDQKRNFIIYNGGFPINFFVNPDGTPAEESLEPHEIQITRGMKLAAIVQALQLLEVIPYFTAKQEKPMKEYIKLDIDYQWKIIQAFYIDLMQENLHKQIDVVGKSNGIHQPKMSAVLNIPYYVTTHNQIEMQNKLRNQEPDIKTLVIRGTAGSGKTILARHYYHKRKIQFPEHVTRIILAETLAQWRSSLREWAEESQYLRDLLKTEQDSERQDNLIKKHLRELLKSNEWCVVIDNWDENEVGIENIEEIFSNIHQNNITISKGVLLITTQSKSPYLGPNQSLDLSFGLSPEESKTLMMNIINAGEISINLGSEESLQALIILLDHLPLALVIAASYLRWENESRGEGEDVFTYEKYIEMLAEPLSKLDAEYDKLKGKGLIPRDLSRKEFRRIKTQEAAVDLSLKKAIKIESTNPNMNLWQMLCFCGFLASDGIPQKLLKEYLQQQMTDEIEIEFAFNNILHAMQSYSLLHFEKHNSLIDNLPSLHMHRVIQCVIREYYWPLLVEKTHASPSHSIAIAMQDAMQITLDIMFLSTIEEKAFPIIRIYLSHVEEWMRHYQKFQQKVVEPDINHVDLQHTLALAYNELDRNKEAEALYESVLAKRISYYQTKTNVCVAKTQQNLANTLEKLGRYDEAKTLYLEALVSLKELQKNTKDLAVSSAQQNLAIVLEKLGFYREAEILTREALISVKAHYGTATHIAVATTQQNLANILIRLGRYYEAEALYREALIAVKAHYGTIAHVDVAVLQQNLVVALNSVGRYEEAATLIREALTVTKTHYGTAKHIRVAMIQQNLAITLQRLDCDDEAETIYQEALDTITMYHGTIEHINVADIQENLAVSLRKLGRHIEAKSILEKALATKLKHYGTEIHIRVATAQGNLAELFYAMGENNKALALIKACKHTFQTQEGGAPYIGYCCELEIHVMLSSILVQNAPIAQHYKHIISYLESEICFNDSKKFHNVACIYHLLGIKTSFKKNFSKAEKYFKHALKIDRRTNIQIEYANFLRGRKRFIEANVLLNESLVQNSEKSGSLSYWPEAASVLPLDLAEEMKKKGRFIIHHPIFFAYYLKIKCLDAAQAPIKEIEFCLKQFTDALKNFYQTNPEDHLYNWLLKNSCKFLEKHVNINTPLLFFETRSSAPSSVVIQGKPYNP